jgi:class 3 adenylate cyclase
VVEIRDDHVVAAPPSLTVSLFTDIVGSTAHVAALGDLAWAELLGRHQALVRAELERFGGVEMDTAGDGFFAMFGDVPSAVRCAVAAVAAVQPLGIALRAGVHVGDCVIVGSKCTGLAIHIGARLTELAAPGEILVSEQVRAAAPGVAFEERGSVTLRGVPGDWSVYAVVTA